MFLQTGLVKLSTFGTFIAPPARWKTPAVKNFLCDCITQQSLLPHSLSDQGGMVTWRWACLGAQGSAAGGGHCWRQPRLA